MKKGDIILIPFPFTDLSGQKNRPAVVVFASETDIMLAFITSQLKWQEGHDLKLEPSVENGLKKVSLVRLSKIASLDKDLALGKLGNLSSEEIKLLDQNLINILGIDC